MRASAKSVRNRVARKFYRLLYFCGCNEHVHETGCKESYTTYIGNPVDVSFNRIPDVDYSDKPTISNQSSVDIELAEIPKKLVATGSDSAISMQNSSNDSGKTAESYASAGQASNYSRSDKRLKRYGNSFDKPRSFDSCTIAECDGNDDNIGIVQLEHVSAKIGKSSPKSTLSRDTYDSKPSSLRFGGKTDSCDTEEESQPCLYLDSGSGLFSVHHNESSDQDESLVDEMNTFSRLLLAKRQNFYDSYTRDSDSNLLPERNPLLGNKPKLQRQSKIVQAEIESDGLSKQNSLLGDLEEKDEQNISNVDLSDKILCSNDSFNNLDINDNGHKSKVSKGHIKRSESEGHSYSEIIPDDENLLSADGRTDSYDTFKDLVQHKCYHGRRKNKLSKTTTV